MLALFLSVSGCMPYANNQGYSQYVPLVNQIKITHPKITNDLRLRLDDLFDVSTLRVVNPGETFRRGQGAGNVFVRQSNGNYMISIQTVDNGHAGEEGYVYTDVPLKTSDYGSGWLKADVPGHLFLTTNDRQINSNWWIFVYNLD